MIGKPRLVQPLKWHGGKHYLADKIVALMPKHLHYVEPYAGGLSVLLARDPLDDSLYWGKASYERGVSEVVNDIDLRLTNFWEVLQSPRAFARFRRKVAATPFSQTEWEKAEAGMHPKKKLDVDAAVAFFVRCRQSLAGRFDSFAPLSRNRTRRGMNEQASAWWNCVDGLPAVHERLKQIVILNQDALDVIRSQDGEKTLFYLDPPYLHETRASTEVYGYEMTREQHHEMLQVIKRCQGKVMLSGYPNKLYDRELADWDRKDFRIDNKASAAKRKPLKTERVWMNF